MIWESWPWKRELSRLAHALQRRKSQRRWQQISSAKLEQEVFFAAYAVRKLIEAFKVSDEVEALSIECIEHPPMDRAPDFMNRDRIDELYDLSESESCRISLREFCNQVIHSFIFTPCFRENTANLAGLFVASDRQKERGLFYFDIDKIIEILEAVVQDHIVQMDMRRDGVGKPARVVQKSCKPVSRP